MSFTDQMARISPSNCAVEISRRAVFLLPWLRHSSVRSFVLGTLISAFSVFCCGKHDYEKNIVACLYNLLAAILQIATFFLLVGWIWSFRWGILFLQLSGEWWQKEKHWQMFQLLFEQSRVAMMMNESSHVVLFSLDISFPSWINIAMIDRSRNILSFIFFNLHLGKNKKSGTEPMPFYVRRQSSVDGHHNQPFLTHVLAPRVPPVMEDKHEFDAV